MRRVYASAKLDDLGPDGGDLVRRLLAARSPGIAVQGDSVTVQIAGSTADDLDRPILLGGRSRLTFAERVRRFGPPMTEEAIAARYEFYGSDLDFHVSAPGPPVSFGLSSVIRDFTSGRANAVDTLERIGRAYREWCEVGEFDPIVE